MLELKFPVVPKSNIIFLAFISTDYSIRFQTLFVRKIVSNNIFVEILSEKCREMKRKSSIKKKKYAQLAEQSAESNNVHKNCLNRNFQFKKFLENLMICKI